MSLVSTATNLTMGCLSYDLKVFYQEAQMVEIMKTSNFSKMGVATCLAT